MVGEIAFRPALFGVSNVIPRLLIVACVVTLLGTCVHALVVLVDKRVVEDGLCVRLLPRFSESVEDGFQEYTVDLEVLHPDWAELASDENAVLTVEVFSGAIEVELNRIVRLPCLLPKVSGLELKVGALTRIDAGPVGGTRTTVLAGYKDCRETRAVTVTAVLQTKGRRIVGVAQLVGF